MVITTQQVSPQDITAMASEGIDAVNDFIREAEHDWYELVHKSQAQPHTVIEP